MSRTERLRRRRGVLVTGLVLVAGVGLGGTAIATADPEQSRVARQAHAEPAVPGTPCAASVRACVDLETRQAWLVRDGKVTGGPFRVTTGGEGKATPVGHSFRVYRKEADHRSGEFPGPDGRPARMPWSVFFADGGSPSTAATSAASRRAASSSVPATRGGSSTPCRSGTRCRS